MIGSIPIFGMFHRLRTFFDLSDHYFDLRDQKSGKEDKKHPEGYLNRGGTNLGDSRYGRQDILDHPGLTTNFSHYPT